MSNFVDFIYMPYKHVIMLNTYKWNIEAKNSVYV